MGRRKLIDEVSIREMRELRELEGLSNGEIAERLGCGVTTVRKYIGSNPGVRKKKVCDIGKAQAHKAFPR